MFLPSSLLLFGDAYILYCNKLGDSSEKSLTPSFCYFEGEGLKLYMSDGESTILLGCCIS